MCALRPICSSSLGAYKVRPAVPAFLRGPFASLRALPGEDPELIDNLLKFVVGELCPRTPPAWMGAIDATRCLIQQQRLRGWQDGVVRAAMARQSARWPQLPRGESYYPDPARAMVLLDQAGAPPYQVAGEAARKRFDALAEMRKIEALEAREFNEILAQPGPQHPELGRYAPGDAVEISIVIEVPSPVFLEWPKPRRQAAHRASRPSIPARPCSSAQPPATVAVDWPDLDALLADSAEDPHARAAVDLAAEQDALHAEAADLRPDGEPLKTENLPDYDQADTAGVDAAIMVEAADAVEIDAAVEMEATGETAITMPAKTPAAMTSQNGPIEETGSVMSQDVGPASVGEVTAASPGRILQEDDDQAAALPEARTDGPPWAERTVNHAIRPREKLLPTVGRAYHSGQTYVERTQEERLKNMRLPFD
jgi:hypothetical protein